MKEYIFLLRGRTSPLTPEQTVSLRQQWGKLITWLRGERKFVDGYIFSAAGHIIQGSPERTVCNNIIIEDGMQATGCVIILAADMEEALLLAQLCPVLDFGGTVEVRERMPQPVPEPVAQTTI